MLKGDKFIKDDTLAYDALFFEPDIFNPKRVIYKQGDVLTVALLEDPETYEDSTGISKHINERMATVSTKIKSIVVDKTDVIENLVKIGDKVEPETTLLSILDNMVEPNKLDSRTLELFKALKTKSPTAKVKGTINKIEVKYNCKFEELSDSIKIIAEESNKKLKADIGFTGDVSEGGYSIEGVPLLPNQVEIKIYILTDVGMGIGDKLIYGNQLKCTVGEVFDYDLKAEDGTVIDTTFSLRSIAARIVTSPISMGTTSMCIELLQKKAIEEYFGK